MSVAFCKAIREAVGDRADLLFGTHGQFNTPGAIRLGQALEPYNPLWYEEPIPPDNLLEFSEVARAVRIPIATGERMTTKAEFATVLRSGGAKILQPALGRAGGIWEMKKLAAIAEVFNALIDGTIKVENGYITPPETPGLGIAFDEDLARAHPYTGTELHLQMQEEPCNYQGGNSFAGGAPPLED